MKNLIYKELKLSIHPSFYLFALLGAMLLIPDYCYYVAFIYMAVAVVNFFNIGRANRDIEYTALLPIRKRDVVKARFLSIIFYELIVIAVAVVFGVISRLINPTAVNNAGIDINPAFFGLAFVLLGGFNFIFLTVFYKTATKYLKPTVLGSLYFILFFFLAEVAAQYVKSPVSAYLDASTRDGMLLQLPVLVCGITIFILLNVWGYFISAKRFERLSL